MVEKPTAAFVLSLLSGIFIILGGLIGAALGAVATFFLGGIGGVVGLLGLVFGIIVLVSAVMLYANPRQHVVWSILILVFSILSWIGTFGGLIIGFILGLVGGILGLVYKPVPEELAVRICLKCGNQVSRKAAYCPYCGHDLKTQAL
ncbi:MAG: DUF6114 domain-containing protein [Candidatus Caldarchaeum sp.]